MNAGDALLIPEQGKGTLFRLIGAGGPIEFYGWELRYRLLNAAHPGGELVEVSPGLRSGHQRHLEHLALEMDRDTPDYAVAESALARSRWRGGLSFGPARLLGNAAAVDLCPSRGERLGAGQTVQRRRWRSWRAEAILAAARRRRER